MAGEKMVSFRWTVDMARKIEEVARFEDRSVSGVCRRALLAYLLAGQHLALDESHRVVGDLKEEDLDGS